MTEGLMNKFGIEYVLSDDAVTVKSKGLEYTYRVGFDSVVCDEKLRFMDTVLEQHDGITYIPAQQVAEIIGATVSWDNEIKKLSVRLNG
ncbi:stalk domain-containing protein [Paenibacillus taihuensis]|uniref:stalk domain-containing protein n=1 Tax=Paenibacillus taihuensis TaxID=1156355 RepID=UPI0015F27FEE